MLDLLKEHFGYDRFRPLQAEIINHVIQGNDSFVLMPTGGGKSLCYQLPALKFPGITLVISPLIALMKDQVDSLQACGIAAEFINSSLTQNQIREVCIRAQQKKVKILYIAPERFALSDFQIFIRTLPVSLIAVDEAHCISEWGHNFRPDYRNLSLLKTLLPFTPLIALTATATPKVQADIVSQLHIEKAKVFVSSFNRTNLYIGVIEKKQAFVKLANLLSRYQDAAVIIYCFSRNETETLADALNRNNFSAKAYHAGLSSEERAEVQDAFIKDRINIIVATIAFGMGIDKPDVRLVVHYTFPKTLEGYYQEIGRAGRDGLNSECILFYTYADMRKHEFFIEQITDPQQKKQAKEKVQIVSNYAQTTQCRKKYLLRYFGETLTENCGNCDSCMPQKKTEIVVMPKNTPAKRNSLDFNSELFAILRNLRKELANEAHVPPFVIFGDTALQEMAFYLPQTEQAFAQINGVGAKKLERYGAVFLEKIGAFVKTHNLIAPQRESAKPKLMPPAPQNKKLHHYQKTKAMIATQLPLMTIAQQQELTPSTIISHIDKLLSAREPIDISYLKPDPQMAFAIYNAIKKHGSSFLKPIFDELEGKYSYDDIRLVMLFIKHKP